MDFRKIINEEVEMWRFDPEALNWNDFIEKANVFFKNINEKFVKTSLDELKYDHRLSILFNEMDEYTEKIKPYISRFFDYYSELDDNEQKRKYEHVDDELTKLMKNIFSLRSAMKTVENAFHSMGDDDRAKIF